MNITRVEHNEHEGWPTGYDSTSANSIISIDRISNIDIKITHSLRFMASPPLSFTYGASC